MKVRFLVCTLRDGRYYGEGFGGDPGGVEQEVTDRACDVLDEPPEEMYRCWVEADVPAGPGELPVVHGVPQRTPTDKEMP